MTERAREAQSRCQKSGCANGTTGGKPYCWDHLEELPYVARLRRLLGTDEEPLAESVDLQSARVKDLVQLLQGGPKTIDMLANRLRLRRAATLQLVCQLEDVGLVCRRSQDWRTEVVSLR